MLIPEEQSYVSRAQRGDKDALSALWDAITPKLYGYVMNVTRDAMVADDTLQETWLKAIANLPQWKSRGIRFDAWLFAIAKNELRQRWRANERHRTTPIAEGMPHEPVAPDAAMEEKLLVETAFGALSEDDREILRLRYIADLETKEIARVLRISAVAARVRIHRALARAQKILTQT